MPGMVGTKPPVGVIGNTQSKLLIYAIPVVGMNGSASAKGGSHDTAHVSADRRRTCGKGSNLAICFPGDQLQTELELRDRYGAARNTVRDAVRMLVMRGLVETKPGQGSAPRQIADQLGVPAGTRVITRRSERYINSEPSSPQTTAYPMELAEQGAMRPLMAQDIPAARSPVSRRRSPGRRSVTATGSRSARRPTTRPGSSPSRTAVAFLSFR